MRKQPVVIEQGEHLQLTLEYYMGKNTQERQDFIIENLKVEVDLVEGEGDKA
jgi:topoisomerase-4 subunit B